MKKPFFKVKRSTLTDIWFITTWTGDIVCYCETEQYAKRSVKTLNTSLDLWVNGETGEGIPCHE
jgi:hypothetical protein